MRCFSRFVKVVVSEDTWKPCCLLSRLLKLFYKPTKSGALPRHCSIATLHEAKEDQAVTWPIVKPIAEHSEDGNTFKEEEGTMHNLCFDHTYPMAA